MAVKINDFEIKDLKTKVEANGKDIEVVAENGLEVFDKALEDAGVDKKEYEKAYKFDQEWVNKLVHWTNNKSEELFKKHKDAEVIEYKLPLNHKSKDPAIKTSDALEVAVIKNKEVPAGKPGEVGPDGKRPTKQATKIAIKARTKRFSFSDAEKKRLEESLREKILGN